LRFFNSYSKRLWQPRHTGNSKPNFFFGLTLSAVIPVGFFAGQHFGEQALKNQRRVINEGKPGALTKDCEVGKSKKMQRTYRECCASLEEKKKSSSPVVGGEGNYWISRGHFKGPLPR
jgi:hypothetical protein